jgi:hypothetical protein
VARTARASLAQVSSRITAKIRPSPPRRLLIVVDTCPCVGSTASDLLINDLSPSRLSPSFLNLYTRLHVPRASNLLRAFVIVVDAANCS